MEWWLSFAPNTPAKSDFDILDHIDLIPDIFLVKRLNDTDFEFRVHGESANNIFDDNIGKTISTNGSETNDKEKEDVRLAKYYVELLKQPCCLRNEGNLPFLKKEHIRFESLDCPLLDENKKLTYIIGTIMTLDDKKT
ncbi:hypothetical protein WH96_13305 [Kiloniella spongiae]|uniref:PAS fold-4 domain-containing protein n=2 Tax=Kiloniella spongiae TaxID=1489064 RepID=A0A0H2MC82_9PROT|nr:hypothetical protein WH96_13305 [Kiloniella spongiae]